jgi:hypothetical protein
MLPPVNTGFTMRIDSEGKLLGIDPILSAMQEVKPVICTPNETMTVEDDCYKVPNLPPNPFYRQPNSTLEDRK